MGTLQKIQQRIIDRDYFMSSNAEEEMVDDSLERKDIENAILKGRIVENMEAEVCTECGERYYHAKTLDAVDAFLSKQHAVEDRLSVEVVRFNQVAA